MQNRYLIDKAMRDSIRGMSRGDRRQDMRDYRGDYKGGMDSRNDYHMPVYPNGTVVEGYGYGNFYPMDPRGNYDQSYSSDYHSKEKEYEEDLKEWAEKLKHKVKFSTNFDQIIEIARSHGVKFKEISELEFYVMTLAMATDYPLMASDLKSSVIMAKDFFEDDDIKVSPSEKICIYFYKIVKGE